MLLHSGGDELVEIYESFNLTKTEETDLDGILQKFDDFFIPATNVTYERFIFFTRKQHNEESFEQYMVSLQNLSKSCDFGALADSLVRDVFVIGINDKNLQEKLLNTSALTRSGALQACRSKAVLTQQVEQIQIPCIKSEPDVDAIISRKAQFNRESARMSPALEAECKYCGFKHIYGHCPAYGKICANCRKKNHFAKMCRKKSVHQMENDSDECSEIVNDVSIDIINKSKTFWYTVSLGIGISQVKFKIDTGAACNIISLAQYLSLDLNKKHIQNTDVVLRSFTKNKVPVIGKCTISCCYKSEIVSIEFMVVDAECINILGLETSEQLGLISRVDVLNTDMSKDIPKEYLHLFDGSVGCIPHVVKIEVDDNVKPVVCPLRRIPYALLPKVKDELNSMESAGIIKKTDEPTPWVNQMAVVVKKDSSLRICLDPRNLNKAIKRSHFPFPTVEEISASLQGAKLFCKLDALSGFWMLPLDESSSKLCTFQTPWGRYSFLRLPFGLNSAPEIFHAIISQTFSDIKNVVSYQDDILIWGDSKTEVEHTLRSVLERAEKQGIKFKSSKCVFFSREVEFLGHVFSDKGVSVSPEKVKAITELKQPTDNKSLQRVLGMFNYLSKFIPYYSDITAPLRELLKDDVVFLWNELHTTAFDRLKTIVTKAPVLKFFDPQEDVTLSVDASSEGLGATVLQNGFPLGFASRALTETQCRYSQIEKELLAVCFGVEKFKQYVLGKDMVKIETDHKPLLGLFDKPLHKVPARLQRMLLRLYPYKIKLVHVPGKYMYIADSLSRDFNVNSSDSETVFDDDSDILVSVIVEDLPLFKSDWESFVNETNKDQVLVKLKEYILNGWPVRYKSVDDVCKPYFEFRNELVVVKDVIFRGNRILVPKLMKNYMLLKLHTGHPGMNRMLSRAEESLYWIGITQDIKRFIKSCKICLKYRDNKIKILLQSRKLPKYPWMEVAGDVFELYQKSYLVLVDTLTNYCEVVTLPNLRCATVIDKIKSIFARHGIPLTFLSDGALYFDSQLFKEFSLEWGFNHIMSSPHYPQSNGHAEVTVKSIKRLFKKSIDAGEDPYLALLNFRNTPHGKIHSPASNLMGRNLRTNIPCKLENLKPKITVLNDRKTIMDNRAKTKLYYDKTARNRPPFQAGQPVMFQKQPSTIWIPGKVIKATDTPRSYIVEGENGGKYRRNEINISERIKENQENGNSTSGTSDGNKKSNDGNGTDDQNHKVKRIIKPPSWLKDYVQ